MKRLLPLLALAAALCAPLGVSAQSVVQTTIKVVGTCGTAVYVAGKMAYPTQDTTGVLCTSSSGGGGGAVTVANGADVTQGAIGDTAWSGSGNGTIDAILKAIALNTTGNATLTADTHAQCAALCSNLVVKASAGTLKTFEVSADSTLSGAIWYVIVFDATSLPANGAITPAKCYQQASGTTQMGGTLGPGGTAYLTGITIGVSTTGCFTQTSSTHAFIAGDFQ